MLEFPSILLSILVRSINAILSLIPFFSLIIIAAGHQPVCGLLCVRAIPCHPVLFGHRSNPHHRIGTVMLPNCARMSEADLLLAGYTPE